MKKIITLGILSLGIVFLAGCGQSQNTDQQVTQPQNIAYTNSDYGFTLIFPETWKDYTVKNATFDGPTLGSYYAVGFGFTAQDVLFYISMYSKSQWVELQSEAGPISTYLAENNQYIFTYRTAQDAANETMIARMSEVQEIVKTFVVTNSTTSVSTGDNNTNTVTYEKFSADDIELSFDIPTGAEVNDELNGFPNSYKFTYDGDSYMVFYGGWKDGTVNYDQWIGKTNVTIVENANSKIYTVDGLANTEVYLLKHDPIVTIEVVKQEGTVMRGETSSSDDAVYQYLVSSLMFEDGLVF